MMNNIEMLNVCQRCGSPNEDLIYTIDHSNMPIYICKDCNEIMCEACGYFGENCTC